MIPKPIFGPMHPHFATRRGHRHHKARLTTAQVREMRDLHERAGKGYRLLGVIFGCSMSTARDIVKRRTRVTS